MSGEQEPIEDVLARWDRFAIKAEAIFDDTFVRDIRRLTGEVRRLQAWKDEQLEVEAEWDVQAVGRLLGVTLGHSVRAAIEPGIKNLRLNALNAAAAIADKHAEPPACDNLSSMDMETGVRECYLEARGACLCLVGSEKAEAIAAAIRLCARAGS